MKDFVGVTDNDWFVFLSQQPNKIWGTDLHFSLLVFSAFFVTCESKQKCI